MKTFWDWLIKSSADPNQVALTAKGLVSSILPMLMIFVHNPNLSTLPDDLYSLITAVLGLVAGVMFVYGILRKVAFTFFPPQA